MDIVAENDYTSGALERLYRQARIVKLTQLAQCERAIAECRTQTQDPDPIVADFARARLALNERWAAELRGELGQ